MTEPKLPAAAPYALDQDRTVLHPLTAYVFRDPRGDCSYSWRYAIADVNGEFVEASKSMYSSLATVMQIINEHEADTRKTKREIEFIESIPPVALRVDTEKAFQSARQIEIDEVIELLVQRANSLAESGSIPRAIVASQLFTAAGALQLRTEHTELQRQNRGR